MKDDLCYETHLAPQINTECYISQSVDGAHGFDTVTAQCGVEVECEGI
jgi:hypothetical protein